MDNKTEKNCSDYEGVFCLNVADMQERTGRKYPIELMKDAIENKIKKDGYVPVLRSNTGFKLGDFVGKMKNVSLSDDGECITGEIELFDDKVLNTEKVKNVSIGYGGIGCVKNDGDCEVVQEGYKLESFRIIED